MQTETPEEKTLIKLSELAGDINNEFRNSNQLAVDAIRGGAAAVKAAIRAGQLLTKAKRLCGHGYWLKWLSDNCPDINERTAQNWMRLANAKQIADLSKAKNIKMAYQTIGILPEPETEKRGIGTAPVDIFTQLVKRFDRLGPVIDIAADVDPQDMPHEQRAALLERAKPFTEFVDRVKAVEAA